MAILGVWDFRDVQEGKREKFSITPRPRCCGGERKVCLKIEEDILDGCVDVSLRIFLYYKIKYKI